MPATELAAEMGMEQSACSRQLRLLRNLGLVVGTHQGRSVVYALYDDHVAELLDQALCHVEHLHLGLSATAATGTAQLHAASEPGGGDQVMATGRKRSPAAP
ncbi:helix-turn-helix domain-containing protein [Actinomadura verrucosospora]|uniref:Regulatory protein n=1 Tax=Actinomadura verrucosospora TaxID=46165 RepID=A0A7D3VVZ4_ACTVE|nr:helix-turn-helix domain-containing protein [Actinomadura verrucosospora]QKG24593.1 regulatory protein [Actinomadura verrucosospora]